MLRPARKPAKSLIDRDLDWPFIGFAWAFALLFLAGACVASIGLGAFIFYLVRTSWWVT